MVPTFTGTSRRPRQVNLSGRTSNPFAAANPSARTTQQPSGLRSTVESARQERLQREQDRTRHQAAKQIQRVWRGHLSREKPKTAWRSEWDAREQEDGLEKPAYGLQGQQTRSEELIQGYKSGDICLQQLRMLLRFASPTSKDDDRIDRFSTRLIATIQEHPELLADPGYTYSLNRFRLLSTKYTRRAINHGPRILSWINMELELLSMLAQATQRDTALQSGQYYGLLSIITTKLAHRQDAQENISYQSLLATAILTPLRSIHSETLAAYEGFATTYMTTKNLNDQFNILDILGGNINYKLLARALAISLRAPSSVILQEAASKRLWLLSYFIYFHHPTGNPGTASKHIPELDYVLVISILLTSLADDIKRRIGIEPSSIENMGEPDTLSSSTPRASPQPLPTFVRQQISSLVDQKRISNLLTHMSISQGNDSIAEDESEEARALASYALTLLRVFSEKGYEIRMWLYLGSTTGSTSKTPSRERLPAIKYFWNAAKRTEVFKAISKDSKAAIDLLRRDNINEGNSLTSRRRDQEWRIILLFFELYAFVLKVADDDEFFSSASKMNKRNSSQTVSWARESALPLPEVRDLSIFLKNLAFTLYWNSSDILGTQEEISTGSLSQWFSTSKSSLFVSGSDAKDKTKPAEISIAGVNGMTLDHVKGTVTGLLRMIYERDSRRQFLPKDHWLMTVRFDMERFIPAVVAEEENRHRIEEADEEDNVELEDFNQGFDNSHNIIGTSRAQQARNIEVLHQQQRKASRQKYLEAVTPRLEILQNMPFFIPFETRVQIFREFVAMDQTRRRGGHIDPDNWRMSIMQNWMGQRGVEGLQSGNDIINRHHAKVRRESVFEDAFDQFYKLGEGLKEPIQITFIDKFNTVEAGIDGGGVTKEFLTSITNEAFSASHGFKYFVENDQNLLYPNPVAIDERRENMREIGFIEGSPEWNEYIRDLLKRYEFLGRVIGKCLYEGILVDIGFAGFFLLKWALTGGTEAASKETNYRASLNDLKDLDEGLYQGLLQLKNYAGNVEDFSLNFTITDTIQLADGGAPKYITKELKPGGSNIPVTNENRLVYISLVASHRLQAQPYRQTNAFLNGLGEVIQPSWLSMFNQAELQTLVGGASSEIDVKDLRKNTLYGGVYVIGDDHQEHSSVRLFWNVMKSLTDEERRKVLKFVTSTPRAPLLGFEQLNPRFSIRDAGDDQERLPSTSTCVNLLKLPRYSNEKVLREKLLYAVNSGAGFDLS